MSKFGDVANAITGSVGKSQAEMYLMMATAAYSADHPEVLYANWMFKNKDRIRDAIIDLGIELPQEGPDLFQRIKDAVMPILGGLDEVLLDND